MRFVPALCISLFMIACSPSGSTTTEEQTGESEKDALLKTKPDQYLYAKIPWGSNKNAVKTSMNGQGFKFVEQNEEGDLIFSGEIAQEDTTTYTQFNELGKLVRIQHIIEPPDNKFFQKYEIILESLVQKYGEPTESEKHFDEPYKEGDGYETQAIRLGKATYNTEWWTNYVLDQDDGQSYSRPGLTLFVKDKLLIYLTYSSSRWNKEYERRYKKGTDSL